MTINNPPAAQTMEEFSLPEGAVIEGYYISKHDGLRYPYGRSNDGFWVADDFGWAQWMTREARDTVIGDDVWNAAAFILGTQQIDLTMTDLCTEAHQILHG